MIEHIVPLIGSYFSSGFAQFYFFPLLILAFIAIIPCLLRYLFRR